MISTPYYRVGNIQVDNQYKAWREIVTSRQAFRFVCYEQEYDQIDWTQEPTESWNEILRNKCDLLRQRYRRLSLFYSAGRDSDHILQCFDRFGIPLDQLILIEPPLQPSKYFEFEHYIVPRAKLYQQHWPQCKIKIIKLDKDLFERYYRDNWLESSGMTFTIGCFNPAQFSWLTEHAVRAEPNHGVIVGSEKPRIVLEDDKFYSVILDKSVEFFLSSLTNFELFYYSPDYPKVHVKQTWMVLRHLEQHYNQLTAEFLQDFCGNPFSDYYDEFCQSCGRGIAWNLNLDLQNGKNKYQGNGLDPKLVITTDYANAHNWQSLHHYQQAFDFLAQSMPQAFQQSNPRLGTKGIWGKKYFLKEYKPVSVDKI